MSNKFIYPDYYSQEDNGHILAGYGLASNENLGLITSSDDTYDNFGLITNLSPETPTTDSYGLISSRVVFYLDYGFLYDPILGIEIIYAKENYGELYLTNIVDFGEINLDSNPPSTLNYTTRNVDESEDYGSLRYGLRDPFSIENYGLISQSVTESESYELISTPIYSFGTTSKTTAYGSLSILYPQSPDDYELISSSPTENIDYGLLWISYDEILNYGEVIYRFDETVTPYGSLTIGGGLRESFTPQTAVGSGSISASGVKGEAITDFYGVGSVAIDTSLESLIDFGSVASAATETEDYGLITASVDEVDSYGFLYPVITPFGLFNISGSASNIIFKQTFLGSGSVIESGFIQEKNTDRYTIDSILLGGSPEDYGSVGSASTSSEVYGLVNAPIDQTEDYHYIFYPAGETITPYGTFRISGASFDEIRTQFIHEGSGSISASGVKGEAITKFYGIDSSAIDTSIESSVNYGLISNSVDESEDYGLITATLNEVDSYGFLQTLLTSFGVFNITGTARESFNPAVYIGSGSVIETGVLEEKNTDRYSIDSILPGASPEDYGTVNTSATSSEAFGLVNAPIDQTEDYHYVFYPAGETITPYGTFRISGASFDELKIQFVFEGSGSISASGVKGEAITDSYNIDSSAIDNLVESSINYGLVSNSVDETEDYELITTSANEVDSYGFLYPVITSFGLFEISGAAREVFKLGSYVGSGSILETGVLEEKNTDRYTIDSILLGGSPEDYGSVGTAATSNESYGLITAPIDQSEDYHYIFYPAGETIYPYGTFRISGASFDELKIQFVFEGSGSISASGVKGEAITKFYGVDSTEIDTSLESSIDFGSVTSVATETEDYGSIIDSSTEVDSYGFLYPVITSFGLFNISGAAKERFKPATFIGSGSILETGVLEEKNTDRYTIDSVLLGGSPEDYGSVGTSADTSESYGLVNAPVDQTEDYHYIFYPAGETITPYGTFRISGASFDELRIKFIHEGSGSISASGVKGEAITDSYNIDSSAIDNLVESSINYGLVSNSVDETEDYGSIINSVTEVDSYGFLQTLLTSFGVFNITGTAAESFKPAVYIGSGSITNNGVLEEKNTDRYSIDSILPGSASENYGTVNAATDEPSESYGLITAPVDQAEDYHYIFYPAGETITPYGTFRISGASFDELKIQFVFEGSGSISASGVKGEAITDSYSVDSVLIDTSIEFSTSYGLVSNSVDETEDYGSIIDSVTEVDSYGFLYPVITPFGLFNVSGSARERFKPATFIGSGFITNEGILEEKNTDRYTIDSILLGGSPEDYGSVGTSADTSESYGLVNAPVDQVENYDYIFYPAGETITPYGTFRISGASFDELRIKFIHEGSGSISASGVKGEAITKFYGIDSDSIDTSIEFSTSYGLVSNSVDETEDYGSIIDSVTEVDSYGFLYPVITPFGLFEISGSASAVFKNGVYVGSGSIVETGILEEKNTDSYNLGSILPGGSPEDYGSVGSVATSNESYEFINAPVDQAEDYHYIFYPAGETITPYGTFRISGDAVTELAIQFIHEGSGSIAANGVAGEAITKFYSIDSIAVDTSVEFSTSYGLVSNSVDESEDYGLITTSANEVDSYGFLYPVITPFGLFEISGSASAVFKNGVYVGSGSIVETGILEEKNTDRYTIDSILLGGSPEDYGSVGSVATSNESYEFINASVDQAEDYHYIFYPAGETITPYGTIQVSGASFDELRIKFIHEGSGSIAANGVAGEAITKFYSIDSIAIDTSVEFSTSYGSIVDSIDETEDYGLIIDSSTEVDSYGFLYPVITPFGLFNISGSAREVFKLSSYIGSGSIVETGILEEKNTDSYNINSVLLGGSPEDYGSVGTAATSNESYGLIDAPVDQVENYDYIFYPAGETITPYGTIRVSGDAVTELAIQFIHEGSGSISANGVAGEAITKFYGVDSVAADTSIEFSTFYGLVSNSVDDTEDYGLITSSVTEVDSYGFLYPVITPFGLFNVSGSAGESFKPAVYIGSGSVQENGTKIEKNTDSYNLGSILLGDSPEDYGSVGTSATSNESYEFINAPVDQAEDYHYIFYPAGETITPYGTIQVSGASREKNAPAFRGSGTINIIGYALVPQRYLGSGSFSAFGGSAEVSGSNPPDQVTPIVISGAATNLKNTYSNVGSGTIIVSGDAATEVRGQQQLDGSGTIEISGTAAESFIPATAIGSGTLFAIGGSAEVSGSNPPDQTVPIVISGAATDLKNTYSNVGSGFFSAFGGSAEVSGSNPPDQTVPIVISGAATNLKNTYSNVGSGTGVFSGTSKDEFRGLSIYSAVGTIEISGTAAESFIPATAIGSGTLFAIGGGAEVSGSNPPDQVTPIVISGAATNLKNTYSNVGSGTGVFSGTATNLKNTYSNVGSGTGVFSGTAAESFIPATAIGSGTLFAIGGGAEVKGSNPPDQTVPIVISGAATNLKNTYSNVGSGFFSAFGGSAEVKGSNPPDQTVPIVISGAATQKRRVSEVGSGTLFGISGSAEASGANPPDQTLIITLSGTARERFTPATAIGSGSISESGQATDLKNTRSEVGIGTVAITGGITPDVQIYVPYWTGSGTLFGIGGAAEVSGSNPPDRFVLFTFSGTAAESFVPATAVGSGTIEISGVGVGVSNPYRAPFVYVTII